MRDGRLLTLFEQRAQSTIRCNGLLVPVASLSSCLLRYCAPLVFYNSEYPDFAITRRGSAFRAIYKNLNLLFSTDHQNRDYGPEAVGIIRETDGTIVTSHRCTYSQPHKFGGPSVDLRVFEFTDAVKAGELPNAPWFSISTLDSNNTTDIKFSIAVGFPHHGASIDHSIRHLHLAPRGIFGFASESRVSGLEAMQIDPALDFDPDGLSGGPVFSVVAEGGDFKVVASGMVVLANRSLIHYIATDALLNFAAAG